MTRSETILTKAFNYSGPTYRLDSKGRKVRVFNAMDPLNREVVRNFYIACIRACEESDALEGIGFHGFRYAVKCGYLVKMENGMYAVSRKAAKAYNLPKPKLASGGPRADWLV